MTKDEKNRIISKEVYRLADEIHSKLYNIVWENQEGQEEHFDRLNKSEKVAIIGMLNNANNLIQSIKMYQSWFC